METLNGYLVPNPHARYEAIPPLIPFPCHWFVGETPIPATFTEGMKYLDFVQVTLDKNGKVMEVRKPY